jgi:hypothetical protein|tara:strand:+ start:1563 stop:1751 length:189 start_codon:yes stop_codon:yes gene_type:complete
MEELIDLIATDSSPSDISDKIKDLLFAKTSERIEGAKPYVASSLFGGEDGEEDDEEYTEDQE